MKKKVAPVYAVKAKINFGNSFKLWFLAIVSIILWIVLIVTGLNLLIYYVISLVKGGPFDQETLKYAVFLVVGAYFFLILDKAKIYEALNIKKDLPFITFEQIKRK